MRRQVLLVGSVAVLALGAAPVAAEEPFAQGWWTVEPTAAADVPADGLLVQFGASAPTAYAALSYLLLPGQTADKLILKVAPNTASSPGATIAICPLKSSSFDAEQAGPISDAPAYDCTKKVVAALEDSTFTASVGSLSSTGGLAVALLPGDATTRVVLSKPDASSLTTTASAVAGPEFPVTDDSGADPASPGSVGTVGSALPPFQPSVPVQAVAAPPVVDGQSPIVATAPSPQPATAVDVTRAASSSDGGGLEPRVVVLLVMGAAALGGVRWAFGSSGAGPAPKDPELQPN